MSKPWSKRPPRVLKIGGPDGPELKVVTPEQAEHVEYVVCMRKTDDPGEFTDNLEAPCAHCWKLVVFRPYVPKKPPKICVECAVALSKATKH